MKCVLYARSRADQKAEETKSVRQQLTSLKQMAHDQGWQVVSQFIDRGSSADDVKRPGLQRLLAFCEAHKVDLVLVSTMDRLVRSPQVQIKLFQDLTKRGVRVRASDTPSFLEQLWFAMLEAQRHGNVPRGYRRPGKAMEKDASEAKLVRRMFKAAGAKTRNRKAVAERTRRGVRARQLRPSAN
jgi:ribosomal protein L7Ae-like RNA K-turn-binding protein